MEIVYTLLYALLIGFYNTFKKIAVKKSSESSILVIPLPIVAFVSFEQPLNAEVPMFVTLLSMITFVSPKQE